MKRQIKATWRFHLTQSEQTRSTKQTTKNAIEDMGEREPSWSYTTWTKSTSLESHRPPNKNLAPGRNNLFVPKCPIESGNNVAFCLCHWLSARGWRSSPIAEDIMFLGHSTWKIQSVFNLRASSLWTCFHRTRMCYVRFQRRKAVNNSTHLCSLCIKTMTNRARYLFIYFWILRQSFSV